MKVIKLLGICLLGVAGIALCADSSSLHSPSIFHSNTPAGYDVMILKPGGGILSFLGLIECPELEGAQQIASGVHGKIVNADGSALAYFPQHFSFRVTASLRKTLMVEPTESYENSQPPADLLLQLKFRLRTYHGLEMREIQPESVEMIGVPADIPYDERVYRISFSVVNLPVSDRCVLEVLSPSGELLTKFHFDLL